MRRTWMVSKYPNTLIFVFEMQKLCEAIDGAFAGPIGRETESCISRCDGGRVDDGLHGTMNLVSRRCYESNTYQIGAR